MNTTLAEKKAKELLLDKTWEYLNDNFHKFNEQNKIKIALALCTKAMPTEMEHSGIPSGDTKVVVVVQETNGNKDTQGRLSGGVSILREEVPSL